MQCQMSLLLDKEVCQQRLFLTRTHSSIEISHTVPCEGLLALFFL